MQARKMQAKPLKSLLLIGTTGPISFGQFVVRELIKQKEHFDRIAIYYDTSRSTDSRKQALLDFYASSGIEIVACEGYSDFSVFKGFDCVLSFLGNHALKLQPAIFDLALQAGVRHLYPSEYGADLLVGRNWTQRYYRDKVLTREYLEARSLDTPDMGCTLLMNGRLAEWSISKHFGIDNATASANIYGSKDGRQSLVSAYDAAAYVVATLRLPVEPGAHRSFRLSTSSPTYEEIFDILRRITGNQYQVTYLQVESANDEEKAAQAAGDVDAELSASHKLIQGLEGTMLPEPWDNGIFPDVEPMSIEAALRQAFETSSFRKAYGLA